MDKLRFGNLVVETKDQGLAFRAKGNVVSLAHLGSEDLQLMMAYMKSFMEDKANRRSAFRLDMSELQAEDYHRFEVTVLSDRGRIEVRPVDFSLTGMLIEADESVGDDGDDIILSLKFDSYYTLMSASVIRTNQSKRQVALQFADVYLDDGSIDPPVKLADIFQSLEALWLDNNLKLQWGSS